MIRDQDRGSWRQADPALPIMGGSRPFSLIKSEKIDEICRRFGDGFVDSKVVKWQNIPQGGIKITPHRFSTSGWSEVGNASVCPTKTSVAIWKK
jgi:hypothetical protein